MRGYRADVAFDGEAAGCRAAPWCWSVTGSSSRSSRIGAGPDGCRWPTHPALLPGLIDAHSHLCGDSSSRALDRLPGLAPTSSTDHRAAPRSSPGRDGRAGPRRPDWAVVDRHRGRPTDRWSSRPARRSPASAGTAGPWAARRAAIDGLRRAVRERAERGADLVKIMASGGGCRRAPTCAPASSPSTSCGPSWTRRTGSACP